MIHDYQIAAAVYLCIVNLAGLIICGVDKRRAVKGRWRIPERRMILTAAVGGSIGVWVGMYLFHHKTKHLKFVIGMPAILLCQLLIAAAIIYIR